MTSRGTNRADRRPDADDPKAVRAEIDRLDGLLELIQNIAVAANQAQTAVA